MLNFNKLILWFLLRKKAIKVAQKLKPHFTAYTHNAESCIKCVFSLLSIWKQC